MQKVKIYTVYPFYYYLKRLGLYECPLATLLNKIKICEHSILFCLHLSPVSFFDFFDKFLDTNSFCSSNIDNERHSYIVDSYDKWCISSYQFFPLINIAYFVLEFCLFLFFLLIFLPFPVFLYITHCYFCFFQ